MSGMFSKAVAFNQPLNNWDTSNVTNMSSMFDMSDMQTKGYFNQDISNWNVSKVTNMTNMFKNSRFSRNIRKWKVPNIKSEPSWFALWAPLNSYSQYKPMWWSN